MKGQVLSYLGIAFALAVWPSHRAQAVEPNIDMFGFDLDSSPAEIREWLAGTGFESTTTKTPRAEAYVRKDLTASQGLGFAPAERGLDDLFVNQSGITLPVDAVIERIVAAYGEPAKRETAGQRVSLTYKLKSWRKPGQMVWAVQPGFVGVELSTNSYLGIEGESSQILDQALAQLWEWRMAIAGTLGGGLALFLLYSVLPARARQITTDVLGTALYPVFSVLGFFGSRLFTLIFGLILIPLFVFSGCATMVSAVEQGTSWLWMIPWVMGAILAIESKDSGEFRYVILADLIFVITVVGVLIQLSLSGGT